MFVLKCHEVKSWKSRDITDKQPHKLEHLASINILVGISNTKFENDVTLFLKLQQTKILRLNFKINLKTVQKLISKKVKNVF